MVAKLNFPFLGHRTRIIASAVSFMLIAQLILVLIGYNNVREVDYDIHEKTNNQYFDNVNQNLITLFNDLHALVISLQSNDFIKYTGYYLEYRDAVKAEEEREDLNSRINEMHLQTQILDKIYYLGRYDFQQSFVKSSGSKSWNSESVPNLYDMEKTDVFLPLLLGSSNTGYFEKGSLTSHMKGPSLSNSLEQVQKVKAFVENMEGRIVLSNGLVGSGYSSVLLLLTLNTDFMKSIIPNNVNNNGFVTLMDANNHIIWTNSENEQLTHEISSQARGHREGKQNFYWKGTEYINRVQTVTMFGFKLVYSVSSNIGKSNAEQELLRKYIELSAVTLVIAFIISYIISAYILLPFRLMSGRMKRQAHSFPMKLLSLTLFSKKIFSRVSFRSKLLSLLVVAVLIPVGSVSIYYSQFLNTFSQQSMEGSAKLISKQTSLSIRSEMDTYEQLISLLSVNKDLQNYLKYPPELLAKGSGTVPDFSFQQYPRLADVSYFVLYDDQGKALYSSVFSNNLKQFTLDTSVFENIKNLNKVIWLANSEDLFNRPAISLVKSVPIFEPGSGIANYSGYMQIVLKDTPFHSINLGGESQYVILNQKNQLVYQSSSRKDYALSAATFPILDRPISIPEVHVSQMEGFQYVIITEYIEKMNWRVFFFQPMESVLAKNKEIYYRFLFVIACLAILIVFAAWLLSRLLVRPIEMLKMKMEEIGCGNLNEQLYIRDIHNHDEIGELVQSFNQMIVQINVLMQQNIQITEENANNRLKEQELIALKTRAELSMLQQQINPHFLYNTLESINMRSLRYGAMEVSTMVRALADIFRYSTEVDNELVMVVTEIEHTRNYITIQEIRFRDKFTVEWSISEEALSCEMLKFVLQPIVENTIQHGFTELSRKGKLCISSRVEEDMLVLEVRDNGIGMESEDLEKLLFSVESSVVPGTMTIPHERRKGSGIGLNNVYRRLSIYYNGRATMLLSSQPMQGMFVQIFIPRFLNNT